MAQVAHMGEWKPLPSDVADWMGSAESLMRRGELVEAREAKSRRHGLRALWRKAPSEQRAS